MGHKNVVSNSGDNIIYLLRFCNLYNKMSKRKDMKLVK